MVSNYLVRSEHILVEDFHGDLVDERVGDPSTIMAVCDLTELVVVDLLHGNLVGLGVILDGDLGRHTTHGRNLAPERAGSIYRHKTIGCGTHLWQV